MPPRQSPIEQARRWWKERTDADHYVVPPTAAPSAAVARVLRQEGLVMDVAGKRAWILTAQRPLDRRAVFIANYWPVVALVLGRYEPATIAGLSAIKLHLEDFSPPEELLAHQSANQSEYSLPLEPGFVMRLRPRAVPAGRLNFVDAPGGVKIPILSAADVVSTLDEREINAGIEPVSAWLRHLVIRTPDLESASTEKPRAATLQRLADMAGALNNDPLARQLDAAARRISARISPPSRTGVGTRIQVPRQEAEIRDLVGAQARTLPTFSWRALRASAAQVKAYDAYHSTTMEGYRISREISDAIVRGEPLPNGPQDRETLQAAMAIQGYSIAFNEVLARAQRKSPVDTDLILDLHEALFRPSVDAGITDSAALRGWRNSSVSLRGWRHVPPNPKKIPDLIGGLERFAARKDLSPIGRALLVHLEFATIHPFMDGNGRLGRLLMNHVLLSAGLPWVTIRSDERVPFFKAIEHAQVDGDAVPFIRFVWHLIQQSAMDLQRKRSGRKPARKTPRRRPV